MTTEAAISARIDNLPSSERLWTLVAILSFGAFFEIYDIGLSAPLSLGLLRAGIFKAGDEGLFGLTDQASFLAATFSGLYIGTIGFSGIADRLGRRAIFSWSLIWYSVATIVMGLQSSAIMVDLWRLIAGIGAILIWYVRRGLPESPRWLASRGRLDEAEKIVARLEGAGAAPATPSPSPAGPPPADGGTFLDLWRGTTRNRVLVMMIFHVFQVIGYFGFSNWLPTLLVANGIKLTTTLAYGIAISFAAPIAPILFATFADKIERKWQIVIGSSCVAIFGLVFAHVTKNTPGLIVIALGLSIAISNGLMSYAYHTYQSEIFPTAIRARAVGFVYSFSRISVVASGYTIAIVLDRAGSTGVFFYISGAMAVVSLVIGIWGPRSRNISLYNVAVGAGMDL